MATRKPETPPPADPNDLIGGGPKTEEELMLAQAQYLRRIRERAFEREAIANERRRPPGARKGMGAFKALQPGPRLERDPNELPVDQRPLPPQEQFVADRIRQSIKASQQPPIAPAQKPGPPVPAYEQVLNAMGEAFVLAVKKRGAYQARLELRDYIMKNLAKLVPAVGTLKEIIALAMSLESGESEDGKPSDNRTREQSLRAFLLGEDADNVIKQG